MMEVSLSGFGMNEKYVMICAFPRGEGFFSKKMENRHIIVHITGLHRESFFVAGK